MFASFQLVLVQGSRRVIKLSQNQLYHDSVSCVPLPLGILQFKRRVKVSGKYSPSKSLTVSFFHWC